MTLPIKLGKNAQDVVQKMNLELTRQEQFTFDAMTALAKDDKGKAVELLSQLNQSQRRVLSAGLQLMVNDFDGALKILDEES